MTMHTIESLTAEYRAAWMAGMAPSADLYLALAAPADRPGLEAAICAWLDTDEPTTARINPAAVEPSTDPLVERLAQLEADWWDARDDA
jgi:hypothetical protein